MPPPSMARLEYDCLIPRQAEGQSIFTFCASVKEIMQFARIDRIGRDEEGTLSGFQRPQVAKHIAEIRDYLAESDAILPNAVVVAFTEGVKLIDRGNGTGRISISHMEQPSAYVVDGQQRLSALQALPDKDFQVLVAGFMCKSTAELQRQFILINNSRPLPKSLIYELLPSAGRMPERLSVRAQAATIVEKLNFASSSHLKGEIKQHTNPSGVIRDTAIQRVAMSSIREGALRMMVRDDPSLDSATEYLSNFYGAVKRVFHADWEGHTPRTSRLVHGVGIISLGYIAEYLHSKSGAESVEDFEAGIKPLSGRTHWTEGVWSFDEGHTRPWNSLQNVSRDWVQLADHLLRALR